MDDCLNDPTLLSDSERCDPSLTSPVVKPSDPLNPFNPCSLLFLDYQDRKCQVWRINLAISGRDAARCVLYLFQLDPRCPRFRADSTVGIVQRSSCVVLASFAAGRPAHHNIRTLRIDRRRLLDGKAPGDQGSLPWKSCGEARGTIHRRPHKFRTNHYATARER